MPRINQFWRRKKKKGKASNLAETSTLRRLRALALRPEDGGRAASGAVRARIVEEVLLGALRTANPARHGSFEVRDGDVRARFVEEALSTLAAVRGLLSVPMDAAADEPAPPVLSMNDRGCVRMLLQAIVAWGVYPALLPGVGVPPLAARVAQETAAFDLCTTRSGSRAELRACACELLAWAATEELGGEVSARHTCDMLGACLQLLYAPPPDGSAQDAEIAAGLRFVLATMHVDHVVDSLLGMLSARTPRWLAAPCGRALSETVLRPGGFFVVADRMLRSMAAGDAALERTAKQLSTVPSFLPQEAYYSAVGPQLAKILQQPAARAQEGVLRASLLAMRRMAEAAPLLSREHLVAPLVVPFAAFMRSVPEEQQNFDEKAVESSLFSVARILSAESITADTFAPLFVPVFPALFALHAFTSRGISSLKAVAHDTVLAFMKHVPNPTGAILAVLSMPAHRPLAFKNGPSGGIVVERAFAGLSEEEEEDDLDAREQSEASCVVAMLEEIHNDRVAGDILLSLLQSLAEADRDVSMDEDAPSTVSLRVLAALPEEFVLRLLQDVSQTCRVLKLLLSRADEAAVNAALGILSALLSGAAKFDPEQAFLFHELVPELEQLRLGDTSPEIRASVRNALASITSPNPVWLSSSPSGAPRTAPPTVQTPAQAMQQIEIELTDPLVSSRGGALIKLRRLLIGGRADPTVAEMLPHVLDLLVSQLSHQDEFVFGMAVSGIASLGDLHPELVLPRLAAALSDRALQDHTRAKIGEALMQVLLIQGDALPRWFDLPVENALLGCLRDPGSALARASASSVLASVLDALPPAVVEARSAELASGMQAILQTDADAQVRRGAATVLCCVCRALAPDALAATRHTRQLAGIVSALRAAAHGDQDELVANRCLATLEDVSENLPLLGALC